MEIIIGKSYPMWHYGLGCWIESKRHLQQIMREQNCVEVGNEDIRGEKHRGRDAKDIFYEAHPKGLWVGHKMTGYGIPENKLRGN